MVCVLGVFHRHAVGKLEKMCHATEYEMTRAIFCQGSLPSQRIPYVLPSSLRCEARCSGNSIPIWMALPVGCAACTYLLEVSIQC